MRSRDRVRRTVVCVIIVVAAIVGLSRAGRAGGCPPVDDGKLSSCRSAVLSPMLPEFVDAGSAFGACIAIADAWRSCRFGEAGLDQAYVFLGAAFAINHGPNGLRFKRAMPYLIVGDEIALHLLDAAARSGNDVQSPYPQLRFLLAHANTHY